MSSLPNPSESPSLLNAINITSDVRAPGEYKYYYSGDGSSQSDSSYFAISSIWHTPSVPSAFKLLASAHNPSYFVQLFHVASLKQCALYIYKTQINSENESISVTPYNIITLPASSYFQSTPPPDINHANTLTRIYIASTSFVILNDFDSRILLIDINTGKYITLFARGNSHLRVDNAAHTPSFTFARTTRYYNVLDVFDETCLSRGTKQTRTYVFITSKLFVAKADKPTTSLYYIILNNTSLTHSANFDLHALDVGVSFGHVEPFGLKIRKIPHAHRKEWFFVVVLLTHQYTFQYVSDYGNKSLHAVLKQYSLLGKDKARYSSITHIENGAKHCSQGMKLFMHVNSVTSLCAVIYFFAKGFVMCKTFLYADTPEEVRTKLFFSEAVLKLDKNINCLYNTAVYTVKDNSVFQERTICAFHSKCLVIASDDVMYVFHSNISQPQKAFHIYEEELCLFMSYDDVGCLFLLTKDKLFKFIYNERFDLFLNCDDLSNSVSDYIANSSSWKHSTECADDSNNCRYPVFEYLPECVFAYYKAKLQDAANANGVINTCTVCGKACALRCKYCNIRYYCSALHYKYDFHSFHFFECELVQFINSRSASSQQHKTSSHKCIALYNDILCTCNKVLNFIFTQTHSEHDYHRYLPFIVCLLTLLNNFSFALNTEEFPLCQKDSQKEKVLFYMECVFYYFHLNMLKCTFAMNAKLHNLADCYLRTIQCHLLPKLTRKHKGKIVLPKFGFLSKAEYASRSYLSFLRRPFCDIARHFTNSDEPLDITKLFIVSHLHALSLMSKFKLKLNSHIDIKETFVDISLIFEDYFKDSHCGCPQSNVVSYCYLYICHHLVLIGKVPQTIKLLKRMARSFTEKTPLNIKVLALYNLGVLQYAVGEFKVGIHRLEAVYKLITENNVKDSKIFLRTIDSLALAYLNIKALFKSYTLIRMSIQHRKQVRSKENEMKCIKLNAYLNFIIDVYEHFLVMKSHKNKNDACDERELLSFVFGELDKEVVVFEKDFEEVMKIVRFVSSLSEEMLTELHNDNPSHSASCCAGKHDYYQHQKEHSSYENTATLVRDQHVMEREDDIKEYDEDIEVKYKLYDAFTEQQKDEFNKLNAELFKRNVVLRDPLGAIEPLNINYHPVYMEELKDIISTIRCNCLSKEIFGSFKKDKWRDDMFNCSADNCLFALAKYMNLENIKNMIKVERSKLLMHCKRTQCSASNDSESESTRVEGNDKGMNEEGEVISYDKFKMKFIDELVMKENDHVELLKYLDVNDDYLMELYANVFKKNPHKEFILQNPMLILNYIFAEVNEDILPTATEPLPQDGRNSHNNTNDVMTMMSLQGSHKAISAHDSSINNNITNENARHKSTFPIINKINKSYKSNLRLHRQTRPTPANAISHINNNDSDNKHTSFQQSTHLSPQSSTDNVCAYGYSNTHITICKQVETVYFIAQSLPSKHVLTNHKRSSSVNNSIDFDKKIKTKTNNNSFKTQSSANSTSIMRRSKNIKRNNSAINTRVNAKSKWNMLYRNSSQGKDSCALCDRVALKQDEYLYKFPHQKDCVSTNSANCSFLANKDHSKSNYLDKTKDMSRSSLENGGSVNSMKNTISIFKAERPKRKLNRVYLYNKVKRMKEMQELEVAINNVKYKFN